MISKLYNWAMNKYTNNKMFYTYLVVGGISTLINFAVYYFFADVMGFMAIQVSLVFTPSWFFVRYYINKKVVFKR